MRQRNESNQALYVQRADPPFWVNPGDEVDWESYIVGLTPVPDEPPTAAPSKKTKSAGQSGEGDSA